MQLANVANTQCVVLVNVLMFSSLALCLSVADIVWTVMTARFRLPAGRNYNVRASELVQDRQHTDVLCSVLLLDNTVQAFKVDVSMKKSASLYDSIQSMLQL